MGLVLEYGEGTRVALRTVALVTGLCAQVEFAVTPEDTASAMGSGDVDVLATPRVVALCEEATVKTIGSHLGPGQTSVGFRVEITHLVPVRVGTTVVASAALEKVEGKRLTFNVNVTDKCGLVAAGRITRVLVSPATFMEKAR